MSDGGALKIPDKRKGERIVRQLTRGQQSERIDIDMEIKGAGEVILGLQKDIQTLKATIKGQEHRIQELIAFALRIDPTFTIRKD
jgi:hypothetical protein